MSRQQSQRPSFRFGGAGSLRAIAIWSFVTIAVAIIVAVAFPLKVPPPTSFHSLRIIAMGEKNASARASEVWLVGLVRPDGSLAPSSELTLGHAWETRDGMLLSRGQQPDTLRWDGTIDADSELRFLSSPWCGIVEITLDGATSVVDLYAAPGPTTVRTVALRPLWTLARGKAARWSVIPWLLAFGIAIALSIVGAWLVRRPRRSEPARTTRHAWLWYAIPPAAAWCVYLAVFWPGLMSADSLDQWAQAKWGVIDDRHPAAHTMLIWAITRVWRSPAAIALVQIIVLAAIAGQVFAILRRIGMPRLACATVCALFAVSPVNGLMVIALWKDIPYSIAVLGLTLIVLDMARTGGASLQRAPAAIALGITAALAALFRFNGPPAAFGTLAILFIVFRAQRKPLALALAISIGLWLGVRGPLYDAAGVKRGPSTSLQPLLFHAAAHVAAATPLADHERTFLDSLRPLDPAWPYTCYTINPIIFDPSFDWERFEAQPRRLTRLVWDLFRRNPSADLDHAVRSSSLVWRLTQPADSYYYAVHLSRDASRFITIDPNGYGLEPRPLIRALKSPMAKPVLRSQRAAWSWIVWRPALYLYLAWAGAILTAVRLRCWRYVLVAAPITIHSAVLSLGLTAQDLRYQYPVYWWGC